MSTPIADMVEQMLAGGVSPEIIVLAVRTAELSTGFHRIPPDEAAEKRRAWDRERKRNQRAAALSNSEWLELVGTVLNRDGHACQYCGATENLTADHVIPVSRGGTHDLDNLVACCIPCNTKKSNKLLTELRPPDSTGQPETPPVCSITSTSPLPSRKKERTSEELVEGRRKPKRPFPPDWTLSAEERAYAVANQSWDDSKIDREFERFKNHALARDRRQTRWSAAWRNWVTSPYQGQQNGHGPQVDKTVVGGIDRVIDRMREFDAPAGGGEPSEGDVRLLSQRRR